MSLKLLHRINELNIIVADFERRIKALEVSRETHDVSDDISSAYEKKFGKPPHHRMKPETILQALRE